MAVLSVTFLGVLGILEVWLVFQVFCQAAQQIIILCERFRF
jgi:hypothetical protein